jgi:hypothetical protein
MDLLAEDGLLIFSTNYRRFELDEKVEQHNHVVDISDETLDKDFGRNKKIHRCWEIRKYKPEVVVESEFYNADYATSQPAAKAREAAQLADKPVARPGVVTAKPEVEPQVKPETKDKASFNPWLDKGER